ncbi:MAG: response regulator transcription factor [Clostridiales bacterium]|nr:response regulator transcription factor [Clostridiales bacterium]
MDKKIKILIADDHPLLTDGLKLAISEWEDFELTNIASNGQEAVELCEKETPDIVLIDMQMPVLSGADAAKIIKDKFPGIRIVAFTTFCDAETVDKALKARCDGFLLKTIDPKQLRSSLYSVLDGMSVIDGVAMEELRKREASQICVDFSEREIETLGYICNGMSNKEIAEKLGLQPGTVKNMISLMLNKTFCVSRADLSRYAVEHRLIGNN